MNFESAFLSRVRRLPLSVVTCAALAFGCVPSKEYAVADVDGSTSDGAVTNPDGSEVGRDSSLGDVALSDGKQGDGGKVTSIARPDQGALASGTRSKGGGLLAEADGTLHIAAALDKSDTLDTSNEFVYGRWDGKSWQYESVGTSNFGTSEYSFAVAKRDGDETIHIVTCPEDDFPSHFIRARGVWDEGTELQGTRRYCFGRIYAVFDEAGVLHTVFNDGAGDINHVRYEGGKRTTTVIDEIDGLLPHGLTTDSQGAVWFSYFSNNVNVATPHVLKWQDDAWLDRTPAPHVGRKCALGHSGLAIAGDGRIALSCAAPYEQLGDYVLYQSAPGAGFLQAMPTSTSGYRCWDARFAHGEFLFLAQTTSPTKLHIFSSKSGAEWSAQEVESGLSIACPVFDVDGAGRVHVLEPYKLEYFSL